MRLPARLCLALLIPLASLALLLLTPLAARPAQAAEALRLLETWIDAQRAYQIVAPAVEEAEADAEDGAGKIVAFVQHSNRYPRLR